MQNKLMQINAQSVNRFFEVLPGEKENAELVVEDLVSNIWLEHFDEVIVDRVTVDFFHDLHGNSSIGPSL